MNASKFLKVVRRYLWLFLAAAIVAGLLTFFVFKGQPRIYEAKTRLLVGPTVNSPSPDLNSLKIGGQLMQTYADMVTTRPILESINNKLDQKMNLETLAGRIETKQNADTRILTIIVTHRDPKTAAAIANAAAESLVEISPSKDNTTESLRSQMSNQSHQVEQIIQNTETSIQDLEAKLVGLGSAPQRTPEETQAVLNQQDLIVRQLAEERARLSDALRTLATIYQVLLDTNANQIQIIEQADAVFPVNNNLPLRVAASALAGLLLVMTVLFVYEYYDDTIRSSGDFTRMSNAPVLSTIEKHNRLGNSGKEQVVTFSQPGSEAASNYRTAVAKLLFSIGQSMPCSFLLSNIGSRPGDDTALAAANLGVAFAQAGYRVILVDAQLNNPVLTELFEASGKAGLYDHLTTKTSDLRSLLITDTSNMQILPAGIFSENWSSAMLNSTNIIKLVEELQAEADIVLFAGPSAPGFAESLTLVSRMSGVILIARYGDVRARMFNEVSASLNAMNVPLMGVIFDNNPSDFGTRQILKQAAVGSNATSRAGDVEPVTQGTVEEGNAP